MLDQRLLDGRRQVREEEIVERVESNARRERRSPGREAGDERHPAIVSEDDLQQSQSGYHAKREVNHRRVAAPEPRVDRREEHEERKEREKEEGRSRACYVPLARAGGVEPEHPSRVEIGRNRCRHPKTDHQKEDQVQLAGKRHRLEIQGLPAEPEPRIRGRNRGAGDREAQSERPCEVQPVPGAARERPRRKKEAGPHPAVTREEAGDSLHEGANQALAARGRRPGCRRGAM